MYSTCFYLNENSLLPKLDNVGKPLEILNFVAGSVPRFQIAAPIFIQKLAPLSFVFIGRRHVQMQR